MSLVARERVVCSECFGYYLGRIPKGGDGSVSIPASHRHRGKLCIGRKLPAKTLDQLVAEASEAITRLDAVATRAIPSLIKLGKSARRDKLRRMSKMKVRQL